MKSSTCGTMYIEYELLGVILLKALLLFFYRISCQSSKSYAEFFPSPSLSATAYF